MVKRIVITIALSQLILANGFSFAEPGCIDLQAIWGRYDVVEVSRYRGGLTPQSEAMERMGKRTLVTEEMFSIWDKESYKSPLYDMECHPIPLAEGEVTVRWERRSDFYGIGMDRDVINVLEITPVNEEGPHYQFEVVDHELWFFFDGWFYRMERIVHH